MSLIHNERTKLTAAAFNTAATSCFTVGVLAPLAATFYNFGQNRLSLACIATGVAVGLALAALIHYCARILLGGLRS